MKLHTSAPIIGGNPVTPKPKAKAKKVVRQRVTRNSPLSLLKKVNADTADEMAEEVGIDFNAVKRPHFFHDANENLVENPETCTVVREDTDAYLGTVGVNYGLVQYPEMLYFTEELVSKGEVEYLRGGYIGNGEQAFVVMRTDSNIVIGPNEDISCYFYASTSHNRSTNLVIVPTPYHKSTGTVLMPETQKARLKFRHSKHVQNHIAKARASYKVVEEYFEQFEKSFNLCSQVQMDDDKTELYLEGLFPLKGKESTTRTENTRERIKELWRTLPSLRVPTCHDTLAGLYLATCYFADHEHLVKHSKKMDAESAQILSTLDGSGAQKKANALGTALTLQSKFKGLSLNV